MEANLKKLINSFLNNEISSLGILGEEKIKGGVPVSVSDFLLEKENNDGFKKIEKNEWNPILEKIARYALYLFPPIENIKLESIYHYTRHDLEIKSNGIRASNFVSNRNDDQESLYFIDSMKIPKNLKAQIIKEAQTYRYNSFSYERIDSFANDKYLFADRTKIHNYFKIDRKDFYDNVIDAKKSKSVFYGYVRYGISGQIKVINFLTFIINKMSKISYWRKKELIKLASIISCFIKRECSKIGKEYHPYTEKKEYRFLYVDLKYEAYPYYYIPLRKKEVWFVTDMTEEKHWTCSLEEKKYEE